MFIAARVDYGLRALLALAELGPKPISADTLASAQDLPAKFLSLILSDLRRAGILISQRGIDGGYRLARSANEITLADVMVALEGPMTEVGGHQRPDGSYFGAAAHLGEVWTALEANMARLLGEVSLDDVVHGRLPVSQATGPATTA